VLFDAWHRRVHAREEDLLRTEEEPVIRGWLARADHGLVAACGDYLLLERGANPRAGPVERYFTGRADPGAGRRITACLSVLGARFDGDELVLDLVASGPCPSDLAIRLGEGKRPPRVDLLFDGVLSPAHLSRGDRVRSWHALTPPERARLDAGGRLRVGALRSSGARPEHADPVTVDVSVGTPPNVPEPPR
jgi:hypothetical protein